MAEDDDDFQTSHKTMKKEYMAHHGKMMDYFRSVDQIVKEGSDANFGGKGDARFKSSAGDSPDRGGMSPLGGKAK